MKEIYHCLYQITTDKLNLEFSEKAAQTALSCSPCVFDVTQIIDLENMKFAEAVYMNVFNRTLDKNARITWEMHEELPKEKFQRMVLKSIMTSKEYKRSPIKIHNNVYGEGLTAAYNASKKKFFGGRNKK